MGKGNSGASAAAGNKRKPIIPGKNSYKNMPKAFRCHGSWVRKVGF